MTEATLAVSIVALVLAMGAFVRALSNRDLIHRLANTLAQHLAQDRRYTTDE